MIDLEHELGELGHSLDFPSGANLAAAVRRRIATAPPARRWWRAELGWRRPLVTAIAVAVVVFAALIAFPPSRTVIAGWLHVAGITIERVPSVPSPSPQPSGSIGNRLTLGTRVTMTQAQAAVPYHILVPISLGEPDQVYLMDPRDRQAVALLYLPRPDLPESAHTGVGLLLIEFPGTIQPDFFQKMLGPDATLQDVTVNGNHGFWITGAPHGFIYLDRHGTYQDETFRLAGNTLVWTQGSLTLRIEADVTKDRALALAASLR